MLAVLFSIHTCSLVVGVFGGHGALGRELIQQSRERGLDNVAFVRRNDPIRPPTRSGWLSPDDPIPPPNPFRKIRTVNVKHERFEDVAQCDALIFCMSGRPFMRDTSTYVVSRALCSMGANTSKIALVSAWGVGDSFADAAVGIRVMNDWYLKSTYEEKNTQESLVSLEAKKGRDVRVWRPRVLCFSKIPLNSYAITRQSLACDILDWIEDERVSDMQ